MSGEASRKEVLELLARGKISIDEAVELLSLPAGAQASAHLKAAENAPLKVEVDGDLNMRGVKEKSAAAEQIVAVDNVPLPAQNSGIKEPRWLRIEVGDMRSGKSKVHVNVPFGMVKFGLGVAQVLAPAQYSANLGEIETMMAESESRVLVDVQDHESNEHVRIYLE